MKNPVDDLTEMTDEQIALFISDSLRRLSRTMLNTLYLLIQNIDSSAI